MVDDFRELNPEATKKYKSNPTIENYLELRKYYEDQEIEISTSKGIDAAFFIKKNKILPDEIIEIFVGTLDADTECQDKLCLYLLEKIAERKKLK